VSASHPDARLRFSATERNRDPILDVLRRVLPREGVVLEIASGSGEHAVHFARHLTALTWAPTDLEDAHLASIDAWRASEGLPNVEAARRLDVHATRWPLERADAIFCANLIHIAPWSACLALLDGAARILPPGGRLVLYGPYRRGGAHTAPSNEAFDASLRARDARWGVRDLEEVATCAAERGLVLCETIAMPANNLTVVLARRDGA
jgi:SAM-dependent methyltransferase